MSIKVMSLVWERAPYKGDTLLLLLALADWSNDDGYCHPKTTAMAEKARISTRSAQYALSRLVADGIVEFVSRSRGGIGRVDRSRGRRQRRIGHEIVINLEKLLRLPVIGEAATAQSLRSWRRGNKRTTAQNLRGDTQDLEDVQQPEFREAVTTQELRGDPTAEESSALGVTAQDLQGDSMTTQDLRSCNDRDSEFSTTAQSVRSEVFRNRANHDTMTAQNATDSERTTAQNTTYSGVPSIHEPSVRHEPSVDPSCRRDDVCKPGKFWTLRDNDDGSFSARVVERAYAQLTGNRITRSDRNQAEMLIVAGFSSAALAQLFVEIQERANGKRIGSLAYFRTAIEELSRRCGDAAANAARTHVGSANAAGAVLAAVRREVAVWKNGGK